MPSIVDPLVQKGGAWTATRGLLTLLRGQPANAEVDLIAHPETSRFVHSLRRWTSAATAVASGEPSKIIFQRRRRMLTTFRRMVDRRNYDLVLINGSDLLWLLPHVPAGLRIVVVAHNIEHRLQTAFLDFGSRPLRSLGRRDRDRLRRYEIDGLRRAGHAVFLSSDDERYARSECGNLAAVTLPPVFSGSPGSGARGRREGSSTHVGMLANFDWWPNREGIDWFLREVLPAVSVPIVVHLFGVGSKRAASGHPGVVGHGYVEQTNEVWPACDFMICPILSGGGVCIKVAEAVYQGVPVLATPFAARGLPLAASASTALKESARDWTLFLNQESRRLASAVVPPELSRQFHMDAHAQTLSEFLESVLKRKAAA